jgi:hypothetical protein
VAGKVAAEGGPVTMTLLATLPLLSLLGVVALALGLAERRGP